MVNLYTAKLDTSPDEDQGLEEGQELEIPFSPSVLDGHHFTITDDPDGNNSNTDNSNPDDSALYDPDYYNPNMYLEADSAGALFLQLLIQRNRQRVQAVAKKAPFHLAGPDKTCIDRVLKTMDADPVVGNNPDQLVGIAQILFNNKQYDEAQALLTFEDPDHPYLPKWPNHLEAALLLAKIAEAREDFEAIVELLTAQNGEARFPQHRETLRILTHGLNRTQRFQQTIAIVQKAEEDMGEATFETPTVLQNYLYALNNTDNSRTAVEKFSTPEGLYIPCMPTPNILISLGLALNACQEYRKTYYFMHDFLQHSTFCNNSKFLSVITRAANELGLYGETIRILSMGNGEYGLHKSIDCLRNLGYAYVFTGRLGDARQLVNFVQTRTQFDMSLIDGVVAALANAARQPADIRQRFSPKRGQSAALFPED